MNCFVLTNNPLVAKSVNRDAPVVFRECGFSDILQEAASYVGRGHRLLTHPLSGSVKPGETPYKSMLVSNEKGGEKDMRSVRLISQALLSCEKFAAFASKSDAYGSRDLEDLQVVDRALIDAALASARGA